MELIEASQPRVGIHSLPSELLDFIVSLVPGRGIIALSLVNKGLRRLALPFFLQNVHAAQLEKPLFQWGRVPPDLLAGVERLSLYDATSSSFAAAARALPRLPNLHAILYDDTVQAFADQDDEDTAEDGVAHAFRAFAAHSSRIKTLEVFDSTDGPTVKVSAMRKFAACEVLRTLVLHVERQYFEPRRTLLARVAATYSRLEALEVRQVDELYGFIDLEGILDSPRWQLTVFRCLRRLALTPYGTTVFAFVRSFAPNIELSLKGGRFCALVLAHLDAPLLTSLSITITSRDPRPIDLSSLIPGAFTLPRGLNLRVVLHCLNSFKSDDVFTAACAERDVHASTWQTRLLAPFSPPTWEVDEGRAPEGPTEQRLLAAEAAVDAACDSVVRICERKDRRGLQEVAEALRKVEERRVLEVL